MAKKREGNGSVVSKLNKIDTRLTKLEKLLKKVYKSEKEIALEERAVEKEEKKIERKITSMKQLFFRRGYLMELIRGTAGAFLGVGLGYKLVRIPGVAKGLSWFNVFGILAFVLIISGLLIYKHEKTYISKLGPSFIFRRLGELYAISVFVELLGLALFAIWPGWNMTLVKLLIVGSYAAMSGAVSFTILD